MCYTTISTPNAKVLTKFISFNSQLNRGSLWRKLLIFTANSYNIELLWHYYNLFNLRSCFTHSTYNRVQTKLLVSCVLKRKWNGNIIDCNICCFFFFFLIFCEWNQSDKYIYVLQKAFDFSLQANKVLIYTFQWIDP